MTFYEVTLQEDRKGLSVIELTKGGQTIAGREGKIMIDIR